MAESTKFQTRLQSPDSDMVEEYAEDNDVSESEAVRRLIKKGLQEEGYIELRTDRDEGRSFKEWTAHRFGRWADRSMYTAVAFGVLSIAGTLPLILNLVEPTVPLAAGVLLSFLAMILFVVIGGLLSALAIGLLLLSGMSLESALPWRTKA